MAVKAATASTFPEGMLLMLAFGVGTLTSMLFVIALGVSTLWQRVRFYLMMYLLGG